MIFLGCLLSDIFKYNLPHGNFWPDAKKNMQSGLTLSAWEVLECKHFGDIHLIWMYVLVSASHMSLYAIFYCRVGFCNKKWGIKNKIMILYWVFLIDDTLIKVMIILKPLQTGSYINVYTEEKIMTCFICLWSIMDIWPGKFKIWQQFNTIICCGTINCLSVNLFMFFWNKLLLSVLFSFLLFVKIQTKPKMNQSFFLNS